MLGTHNFVVTGTVHAELPFSLLCPFTHFNQEAENIRTALSSAED